MRNRNDILRQNLKRQIQLRSRPRVMAFETSNAGARDQDLSTSGIQWVFAAAKDSVVEDVKGNRVRLTKDLLREVADNTKRLYASFDVEAAETDSDPVRNPVRSEHDSSFRTYGDVLEVTYDRHGRKEGLWAKVKWSEDVAPLVANESVKYVSVGIMAQKTADREEALYPVLGELSITDKPQIKRIGTLQETREIQLSDNITEDDMDKLLEKLSQIREKYGVDPESIEAMEAADEASSAIHAMIPPEVADLIEDIAGRLAELEARIDEMGPDEDDGEDDMDGGDGSRSVGSQDDMEASEAEPEASGSNEAESDEEDVEASDEEDEASSSEAASDASDSDQIQLLLNEVASLKEAVEKQGRISSLPTKEKGSATIEGSDPAKAPENREEAMILAREDLGEDAGIEKVVRRARYLLGDIDQE